jgi:hypothetical protein
VRVRNPNPDEPDDRYPADAFDDGPEDDVDDERDVDDESDADDERDIDEARAARTGHARYPRPAPDGSLTFRVRPGVITAKFAVAAGLALVALMRGIGPEFVVGVVAGAAVAIYGLRDLLGRDRLRADRAGVRIGTGFGGHRTLAWSEVEKLRVDERNRLGARSELLEIDAGDELYLLSRFDLGVAPPDALAALEVLRPD